ncbi:MAG: endo-1,4-beta-xylanase [Ktedonobacterales bacterium]
MRARFWAALAVVAVLLGGCGTQTTASSPTATQRQGTTTAKTTATATTTAGHGAPGTRQAGINTMPGMRPWRYAGANPDSWWCVLPNCVASDPVQQITTEMAWAQQLGVTYLRVEFDWPLIEPQRGQFDWSRADTIVHTATADGIQLTPILVFTPPWAASCYTCAPSAQDFAAFVTAVVGRYKANVHYWEIWNEPDQPNYWTVGFPSYVQNLLIPGYTAAHAADTGTHVILGGASFPDPTYYNTIYNDGGGNSFDILAYHEYGTQGQVDVDARYYRGVLNGHGQQSKPIWAGEFGFSEDGVADTNQQALLKQVYDAQSSPIAAAFWYNLRDDGAYTCCPPNSLKDAHWGLVERDGTKKQGFTVLQQLIAAGLPKVASAS